MKVCIFTETYYPVVGGGETQARLLADGLSAAGHQVIILTRQSDPNLQKFEKYGPVSVHRLWPAGSGQMKKWGLLVSGLPALIRLRNQYDLIFVSGYRIIGPVAILMMWLLGKHVVLKADSQGEMSGAFFESGLKKVGLKPSGILFKVFLFLRNRILHNADAFAAISPEIAVEYKDHGMPPAKIVQIPNCVDTKVFTPVSAEQKAQIRARLSLPQDAVIAIYTGRLVSYKGLPLLLRVWDQLRKKHNKALLLLLGEGGLDIHNCEEELHRYVELKNLNNVVKFTGAVRNVAEYLQASDLFAFPTQDDAFPSSVVEAMACGLPVVTTPVGAIKTIVEDQVNGILVIPGDFNDLFNALDHLIIHRDLLSCWGAHGSAVANDRYAAAAVTEKYQTLFQQVIGKTKNTGDLTNHWGNDA